MSLDERIAELRSAVDAEIAGARSSAIEDLLRFAGRMRAEADGEAVLEEARRIFEPSVVEFLKTLAPARLGDDNHLRAQRFARVRVAEIQLYHAAGIKSGRDARDLYASLKSQMDAARDAYREKFLTPVNGTADYLHAEFVRTLANDDAALLGPAYPGPLV
jgi:hypothetical protein